MFEQQNGSIPHTTISHVESSQPGVPLPTQQSPPIAPVDSVPIIPTHSAGHSTSAVLAQIPSHVFEQQNGSAPHTAASHPGSLQPGVPLSVQQSPPSAPPVEPVGPAAPVEPVDTSPSHHPEHSWIACWAQRSSHSVEQQNGSIAHTTISQIATWQPGLPFPKQQSPPIPVVDEDPLVEVPVVVPIPVPLPIPTLVPVLVPSIPRVAAEVTDDPERLPAVPVEAESWTTDPVDVLTPNVPAVALPLPPGTYSGGLPRQPTSKEQTLRWIHGFRFIVASRYWLTKRSLSRT